MGEGGESLGRQAGLKTRRIGGTVDPLRFSIFWQIFVPAAVWFGLVGSLAGLAVGAGLLARSEGTLKLLRSMNRWVLGTTCLRIKKSNIKLLNGKVVKYHFTTITTIFPVSSSNTPQ